MTKLMNNGQQNSNPFDIKRLDGILDEYEKEIGVPSINHADLTPITQYLTMGREAIDKLGPLECAEIAFILRQHAFYIQKAANKEISRITYTSNTINQVVADDVNNYVGSWENSKNQAIKHNEIAQTLQKVNTYAQMRLDRLRSISQSLHSLADALIEIQYNKRGQIHG